MQREGKCVYEMNAFTHFCLLGPQLGGGQRLLWITLGGPEVQGYNQQGSMLGLTLDDAGGDHVMPGIQPRALSCFV